LKRTVGISIIVAVAVLLVTALALQIRHVPSLTSIKKSFRSANLTVLDRNGQVIDEIVKKQNVRRLNWIRLDQVSPSFIEAVLANETWRLSANSITMQLAQSRFWPSLALEMAWSRRQILEAYINLSVYRGELQGISAASQALFDRSPDRLTQAQSAVLASLIRSKGMGVDEVQSKACKLLRSMNSEDECGMISVGHLSSVERSFQVRPFMKMAPHVARLLNSDPDLREGNVVRSTLDRDLQWRALNALQKHRVGDGAVVVIENASGHVLAYVGNSGLENHDANRDLADDARHAGFSIKPFLFAKALDERTLTAATVIEDRPEEIRLRKALQSPLRLPAIRTLELVGTETFALTLSRLGFTRLGKPEYYGPSLALGFANVKLLELTNAFRTLANKGIWSPVRFSPISVSDEATRRVFSEGAAFIVAGILQEEGAGLPWSVVHCDQWCVGFSEKYTVGVLNGGREVWQDVLLTLHRTEPSVAPAPPAGLQQEGGEWFLEGTGHEVTVLPKLKAGVGSRITYPVDRAVIEIDPDRPRDFSRLYLQVLAPGPDQNLYLNGKRLGRARALQQWKPIVGAHQLELRNSKGQRLHQVKFAVRNTSQK
jgi:penicillin-binding protein 1C